MGLFLFSETIMSKIENRRQLILDKILKRVKVQYLGFILNGVPSPCHIWTGPTSGNGRGGGYPRFCLDGVTTAVHLVLFTHFFGFIPRSKQVDHLCNNRLCLNKDHFDLVTHKENQKRRAKRAKQKFICERA